MPVTRMSSRAFSQGADAAKKASFDGPVIITEHGKPAHVLLTFEAFTSLSGKKQTLDELLYMPGIADIDLELPPRDDMGRAAELT